MKEFINYLKENPKRACKEFAVCMLVFVFWWVMLIAAAVLQGCSVQRESASSGKAVIITTDTTYIYHGGTVKFPRTK